MGKQNLLSEEFIKSQTQKTDKPPQYFEGILQLRECSHEVQDFVIEECKKNNRGRIGKVKSSKGGFDFYMQSNTFLGHLEKKLKDNFVGEFTKTATLHTKDKQTSKDLYRITVLFRQSPFKKGDNLLIKGDIYNIISIGKKVIAKELKTNKKSTFTFHELKELKARINEE
jgi:NMD protein affecting ribosome stability and mRNA decay